MLGFIYTHVFLLLQIIVVSYRVGPIDDTAQRNGLMKICSGSLEIHMFSVNIGLC